MAKYKIMQTTPYNSLSSRDSTFVTGKDAGEIQMGPSIGVVH